MFFAKGSLFFYLLYILVIKCNLVSSDDVPAMLWNIKGTALHLKPVSALGRGDKLLSDSLKEIHRQESSLLVFAIHELSLEDFSANEKLSAPNNTLHNMQSFLEPQPHMFLPSVKDPLDLIHKSHHCDIQEIVVDNKIDESVLQSVSSALQKSCVVILHLSDDGIVPKDSDPKSVFLPSFEDLNKNVVGIITAPKASWGGAPNSDHHIFRNLLATPSNDTNFLNITGCLLMYTNKATIELSEKGENNVSLTLPPETEGSSCGSNPTVLVLTFTPKETLSSVILTFNFVKKGGSWKTNGTTVKISGDKTYEDEIELDTASVGAALGFSYSCGDLVLRARNRSLPITIKMNRFQVQPFEVKEVFSESFDCVPFFTIPIWMGIFVALLFIIITNIGVYALFSVRTMDRFDDPKGKTISVGNVAD